VQKVCLPDVPEDEKLPTCYKSLSSSENLKFLRKTLRIL